MKYADGKNRNSTSRESLAALIHDRSSNPFGTLDASQFETKLQNMTVDEKFRLCAKVGVRSQANGQVHIMDQRLREAFAEYVKTQPLFLEEQETAIRKKNDYLNPPQSLRKLLD